MHINKIDIRNFRAFDHLLVEDFGQINVILGKNNSGKTALMEAILLAISSTYPAALFELNQVREIGERTLTSLQGFFHNLSFDNSPVINVEFAGGQEKHQRRVELKATSSDGVLSAVNNESQVEYKRESLLSFTPSTQINQINVITDYSESGQRVENSINFDLDNRIYINRQSSVDLSMSAFFLASNATGERSLERVGYLKKMKLDRHLINILERVDPRIKDIQVIGDKIYFDIEGIDQLLPFNLVGDGIKKIVSILASAVDTSDFTVLLVDEIENGLHYSTHLKLWNSLLDIMRETGSQLFVTTHNKETLRYLNEALTEHELMQSKVRFFDIVKTKKAGYQAYKYTYDGFSEALKNETEIRL